MQNSITRRDAMRAAIVAAAGAAMYGPVRLGRPGWALAQTRPAQPTARAFVTDSSGRRHAALDGVLRAGGDGGAAGTVITIDTRTGLQTILGFGAALTEAACTVMSRLAPADLHRLLDELYSPSMSNLGMGRLCLGASDYSTTLYSYDEGAPDPTLSRFSIDQDRRAVIPVLREARRIRPDLFLFASPWSPPGWMKYGGSMMGGSIKPHYTQVYAQYVLRYLQDYKAAGVEVNAMTIQNEIDADQDGRMPACTWAEETEAQYIVRDLGPALARSGMSTQIWLLDHNYNLAGRVFDQLARPHVADYISAIAWHGYAGAPELMSVVHQHYPQLDMHWTEGGDHLDASNLSTGWAPWATKFAALLGNGVSSITTWNLALDETGHPNIGPFRCAGMVTIDSKTKAVTRNGIYWALVHYAKAFGRGSQVLRTSGPEAGDISAASARRPDGSIAVVLANSGPAAGVQLDVHGGGGVESLKASVTANSVTTILLQ